MNRFSLAETNHSPQKRQKTCGCSKRVEVNRLDRLGIKIEKRRGEVGVQAHVRVLRHDLEQRE